MPVYRYWLFCQVVNFNLFFSAEIFFGPQNQAQNGTNSAEPSLLTFYRFFGRPVADIAPHTGKVLITFTSTLSQSAKKGKA